MAQPAPLPTYEVIDDKHMVTWPDPDGTTITMYAPHEDKHNTFMAYARVVSAQGTLINEGLLQFLDSGECMQFSRRCGQMNGTPPESWSSKLLYMGTHVKSTMDAATAARRPDPLRRPQPPPEPYPVDALGKVLAPMVQALRSTVQAPDAICSQSVLAAATFAAQPHADVVIDGRRFPVSDDFIDIGESGERRSAVDRLALYPHYRYQQTLVRSAEHELQSYENDLEAYRATRGQILKGKGTRQDKARALLALGAPPLAPLDPLIIVEEPTYEGLIKLLARGQPSVGLFSDEGGRFLGGHGMNDDNAQKTVTGLSELWDGKAVTRVRATDASVVLYGRRLSLHLMVQPIIAESVLGSRLLLEQGFLARCLVCWPTSTMGTRTYRAVDITRDAGVQAYNQTMKTLLETKPTLAEGRQNELAPREMQLTREAKRLWIAFHDHVEAQLVEGSALEGVRGFGNKAAEHAARLAGVLTLVEDITAHEIDAAHMRAGIALANFYITETVRLFDAGGLDPDVVLAEKLLAWATGKSRIALAQVYQYGPRPLRDAKTARRIVTLLEDHGWLTRVVGGAIIDEDFRRDVWRVVP